MANQKIISRLAKIFADSHRQTQTGSKIKILLNQRNIIDNSKKELDNRLNDLSRIMHKGWPDKIEVENRENNIQFAPSLTLGSQEQENIHYLAYPDNAELEPFSLAIERLLQKPDINKQKKYYQDFKNIKKNIDVLIFISEYCPFCPKMVQYGIKASLLSPYIQIYIIDINIFPELGEKYAVQSVPFTVIAGKQNLIGLSSKDDLFSKLLNLESAQSHREIFQSLLDQRKTEEAKKEILNDQGLESFIFLWPKSNTFQRLGMMVIAEELLDEKGDIFDSIVPNLEKILVSGDIPLKGDTADLLGLIGLCSSKKAIQALLQDTNQDLVEAAQDAIARLKR